MMLDSPAVGVGELASRLAISTDEVRTCLDELFEMHLVQESFEVPGKFVAVEPAMGLQQLLAWQSDALLKYQRYITDSQTVLVRMLVNGTRRPATDERVEQLTGMDAIQRRLQRLAGDVTQEVLTFMPSGAQSPAALSAARRNDAHILERGVSIRTIGLTTVREDSATLEYCHWLAEQGSQFRTAMTLPTRMIIADRRTALIPTDPTDSRKGVLCLSGEGILAPLVALFEQTWAAAVPLGAECIKLKDLEHELLLLIAQGLTDEAAASHLHVSPRTARRMMAAIMERLGARSRFEAGLKAAQLGLI
ncbi:helix-turn-helix transcriptional regulator [Streptomyces violaceusniger]|uniref:helix-turn-helix transcriptional regulator n=1 Tax=Streptomyces violaceusniger TaxID=68280 RepID=UPI0034180DDF